MSSMISGHRIPPSVAIAGLGIMTVMFLHGCSSPPSPSSKVTLPLIPPPKTLGSLWQEENGRAYLYEDMRAMRIGDILTVKVSEVHKGSKSADTAVQRDSTIKNVMVGSGMGPATRAPVLFAVSTISDVD